jgi:hypothetical protein
VTGFVTGPHGRLRVDDGGPRNAEVPVVLVHGNGGNWTQWQRTLAHLRKTRRAIADWQKANGLPASAFLTRKQRDQLIAETEALMEAVRAARAAAEKAATERLAAEPPKSPEVQPSKPRELQAPKPHEAVKSERKKNVRKSRPAAPSLAQRQKPARKQGQFKFCKTVRGVFQVPANEPCSPGM